MSVMEPSLGIPASAVSGSGVLGDELQATSTQPCAKALRSSFKSLIRGCHERYVPPSSGKHTRNISTAAARIGEFEPSGRGVHVAPPGQSLLVMHVACAGAVQLFLQKVVAVGSPLGESKKVPQQTSSGPQLLAPEHSNCVVVVHVPTSRQVPGEKPETQHVCPGEQEREPNALHDFVVLVIGASGRSRASLPEPASGIPASTLGRVRSLGDELQATKREASAHILDGAFGSPIGRCFDRDDASHMCLGEYRRSVFMVQRVRDPRAGRLLVFDGT